jgi:hypothetical protein
MNWDRRSRARNLRHMSGKSRTGEVAALGTYLRTLDSRDTNCSRRTSSSHCPPRPGRVVVTVKHSRSKSGSEKLLTNGYPWVSAAMIPSRAMLSLTPLVKSIPESDAWKSPYSLPLTNTNTLSASRVEQEMAALNWVPGVLTASVETPSRVNPGSHEGFGGSVEPLFETLLPAQHS